jgi:hypothetical protein
MNIIYNAFDYVKTTFTSNILTTLPLVQSFITFDGIICASVFLRDFLLLNLIKLRAASRLEYKREIIKRYHKIYTLSSIDRYLFYLGIYFIYNCIARTLMNFDTDIKCVKWMLLILIIPSVQNKVVSWLPLNYYLENKEIFVKYSFSKLFITSFQNLHNDIHRISNYNIFILYSELTFDYIYKITRNFLFVSLLYFLKSQDFTYFYYKAIKVAYMYHTGYNFVSMSLYDAVYLANLIIKEKRWNELTKMEVINMFYVLVSSKFSDPNSNTYVNSSIILFHTFSIWSIISFMKIFGKIVPFNYKIYFYISLIVCMYLLKFRNKTRKIITGVIVHYLLHFNINDIIITFIIIGHDIVYYILGEIFFFIRNITSIRKVVMIYEIKKSTTNDFVIVNGASETN